MLKNLLSLAFLLVSAVLSFKHGWDSFMIKKNPEAAKMMDVLGISPSFAPVLGVLSILTGLLLLFPKTFFTGNLLNALTIICIMALSLRAGNVKMALLEIPFLFMPLLLIWLKYPFKN